MHAWACLASMRSLMLNLLYMHACMDTYAGIDMDCIAGFLYAVHVSMCTYTVFACFL